MELADPCAGLGNCKSMARVARSLEPFFCFSNRCRNLWRSNGELGSYAGCGVRPQMAAGTPGLADAGELRPLAAGGQAKDLSK